MDTSPQFPSGPRLVLRDFNPGDIEAIHEYAADPEVTQWSTWGPNTVAQTTAFVENAAQERLHKRRSAYTLAAAVDGRAIGSVGIWTTSQQDGNGELGYTFHRDHWGRGYATEAARLLLELGFTTLDLQRIEATCHPDNSGSIRVLEKSGFTLEGRLRSHRVMRGVRRDSLLFSMLAEDYAKAVNSDH